MQIPVWLRVWKHLSVEKEAENVISIVHDLNLSPVSGYQACEFLDELGMVNLVDGKRGRAVLITQKFMNTESVFNDLYETMKSSTWKRW